MTVKGGLLSEPKVVVDQFDPNTWDQWDVEAEEQQAKRLAFVRRDYAEIDAEVNAKINALEEAAELNSAWSSIALGGPVEPCFPTTAWNGILIVGKAPGSAEVAHGEPFTGKSGRLLDRMLAHESIDRQACMLTNTFRMEAPWGVDADGKKMPNDIRFFFTDDPREGNDRLPPLGERWVLKGPDEHVRDLWRLVRKEKPKVVVALGGVAAWALTHDGTLKGRTGEPLDNPCSPAPVIITYHPMYAIYKQDEATAALIAQHLGVARDIASP
jgi:uracil-DNA glycosylase